MVCLKPPSYAELHALSNFSFQRGASSAEELFERAARLGYRALAITDECSLAGIVRALEASEASGVALIVGTEVQLDDGPKLVLLASTQAAYSELCRIITLGRRRSAKGEYELKRADVEALHGDVLVLWLPAGSPGGRSEQHAGTADVPAEGPRKVRASRSARPPSATAPCVALSSPSLDSSSACRHLLPPAGEGKTDDVLPPAGEGKTDDVLPPAGEGRTEESATTLTVIPAQAGIQRPGLDREPRCDAAGVEKESHRVPACAGTTGMTLQASPECVRSPAGESSDPEDATAAWIVECFGEPRLDRRRTASWRR